MILESILYPKEIILNIRIKTRNSTPASPPFPHWGFTLAALMYIKSINLLRTHTVRKMDAKIGWKPVEIITVYKLCPVQLKRLYYFGTFFSMRNILTVLYLCSNSMVKVR